MTQKFKRIAVSIYLKDAPGGCFDAYLPEEVDAYVSELEKENAEIDEENYKYMELLSKKIDELKEINIGMDVLKHDNDTQYSRILELHGEKAKLEEKINFLDKKLQKANERIAEIEGEACEDYEEILRLRGATEIQADLMRGKERLIEDLKGKAESLDRLMNNELVRLGEYAMLPEKEYEELKRKAAAFDLINKRDVIIECDDRSPDNKWWWYVGYLINEHDKIKPENDLLKEIEKLKESE